MLQILVVVDRLNLEMLLSHEARITRIERERENKNKNSKNKYIKRRYREGKYI
jgi:hypothetical protein